VEKYRLFHLRHSPISFYIIPSRGNVIPTQTVEKLDPEQIVDELLTEQSFAAHARLQQLLWWNAAPLFTGVEFIEQR
jgi:hypothetical protein